VRSGARGTPTTPKDLADHECLSFADWPDGQRWTFLGPEGEVWVNVRSRLQINSSFGLRSAALAGAGIVMQRADVVSDDLAQGRLCALLPSYRTQSRPRHLIWLPNRTMTPKLRAFIDFVAEVFG
jgi:DNA-binding transcriptional LysR family regulator